MMMEYDYFYGPEDAEQYQFYRIPKLLITDERFKDISVEAKLLYGLMLDRLSLSMKNGWFDEDNRVYIIYKIENVMEDMRCGNQKAVKLLAELEKKAGLIRKKRLGLGKPSLIYVLKFSAARLEENSQTCDNHISGNLNSTCQEISESHSNNTNYNNTKCSETDPIYLSTDTSIPATKKNLMGKDPIGARREYEDYFHDSLEVDALKATHPYDHGRIEEIYDLVIDTVCSTAPTIRCAGENRPTEIVRSRFMKLGYSHIQYVLECIHANTTSVRNIKAYMLTTLYNASLTIDHYYETQVNHDMRGYIRR